MVSVAHNIIERSTQMNQKARLAIPYVRVGDYYYPNLELPPPVGDIGFYGRLRRKYLIEQRPVLLNRLVVSGKLFEHLADINMQATERRDALIQQMKEKGGVTEELKTRNQMAWVQQMNNIRACVDEIILEEIVFA